MQVDHYNWQFPSRGQTMYLNTLPNEAKPLSHKQSTFLCNDIDINYRPKPHSFLNKPIFINKTDDIQFASPKLKRPQSHNRILKTSDIEGTSSCCHKFITSRSTNPLNPQYLLPSFQAVQAICPKFIKDSLQIDDIKGTRSKPKIKLIKIIQNTHCQQSSKPKLNFRRKQPESLFTHDINAGNLGSVISKRCTNPLNPAYLMPGDCGQITKTVQKSSPKQLHPNKQKQSFNLKTQDIKGATKFTSFTNPMKKFQSKQAQGRVTVNTNNIISHQDLNLPKQTSCQKPLVAGSQADSLARGLKTKRRTDPLLPRYKYPGCSKTNLQRFDNFID